MSSWVAVTAVLSVSLATLFVGGLGLRWSRTTSDFYVASRAVRPGLNASAISGEYLSAASFLGIAGLVLAHGVDMLWYPVGWTTGYLLLLVFVAAPLRRSGAYTLPDFAEFRVESLLARRTASTLVVVIGVLYLVPQFQGAGLTLGALAGAPRWVGGALVGIIVLANVVVGGMRSITIAQAFQYWVKLLALLFPLVLLLRFWVFHGSPAAPLRTSDWVEPMSGSHSLYLTYSLILATFLGTMGLPHVVVRFYTNPDGRAARRTTLLVLALLSLFYLLPTMYGVLGHIYVPDLVSAGKADSVVLELPQRVFGGATGEILSALVGAGAFAAFLSTSSGLVVSVAGVVSQDLISRWQEGVTAFRIAGVVVVSGALALTAVSAGLAVAHAVELAFAVAASTFCPLLLLGIWWRGLTARGAVLGMVAGGGSAGFAVAGAMVGISPAGWTGALMAQPALVTVPLAFTVMVLASLADRRARPPHLASTMVRLHTPEAIPLDRGTFHPERTRR